MTTKHTPGPWHVDTEDQDADIHSGFGMVAKTMGHGNAQDGEGTANARLIAAAPELLEAAMEMAMLLENALRIGVINENLIIAESIRSVLPIHRAAIAKATGSAA